MEKKLKANIKRAFGNISIRSLNRMSDKELLENKYIGKKTFEYIRTIKGKEYK